MTIKHILMIKFQSLMVGEKSDFSASAYAIHGVTTIMDGGPFLYKLEGDPLKHPLIPRVALTNSPHSPHSESILYVQYGSNRS